MELIVAGVDIGSTMTKVVVLDDEVRASVIGPTGAEHRQLANEVMEQALAQAGISFGEAFEERLGFQPLVPPEPLLTGAIGAALLGRELALKSLERGEPLGNKARRMERATFFK